MPPVDDLGPLRPLQAIDSAIERARRNRAHTPPAVPRHRSTARTPRPRRGQGAYPLPPQIVERAQHRGDEMGADVGLQPVHELDAARRRDTVVDQNDVGWV